MNNHLNSLQVFGLKLLRGEQEERRRIYQHLHDNLQQMIVAAKMMLQRFHEKNPHPELEEIVQILDQAVAQSRDFSVDIYPPLLFKSGIRSALEWLVQWAQKRHQMTVTFHFNGADQPIAEETGFYILRCIKELLSAAAREGHAEAKLRAGFEAGGDFSIVIQDKKEGFNPTSRAGAQVVALTDRLGMMGGSFAFQSTPGEGTAVVINIPAAILARSPS